MPGTYGPTLDAVLENNFVSVCTGCLDMQLVMKSSLPALLLACQASVLCA